MKVLASEVIKKYQTRDPFAIAKKSSALIIREPLGNIYGYYDNTSGQKFIHLNDSLPEYYQGYVAAHMLYRVFTNPSEMLFLKEKRAALFTESEKEANKFANNLLIADEDINMPIQEFFVKHGLNDNDIEDLEARLYRIWDPEKNMPFEELFWHVIAHVRE